MADAALFLGWGEPVHGREQSGLQVLSQSLEFYGRLEQEGRIERVDTVLLEPHGGDLTGFVLLQGSAEQMDALQRDEEFERLTVRASLIVQSLGVVRAAVGEELGRQISLYQEAVGELG